MKDISLQCLDSGADDEEELSIKLGCVMKGFQLDD